MNDEYPPRPPEHDNNKVKKIVLTNYQISVKDVAEDLNISIG